MRIGTASGKPCRISAGSPNRSVCITGLSGTGKTVRLNQLELESIRQHCAVLVIDTSQTHTETGIFEPLRNEFLRYANYINGFDGLGLDIFQTLETPQGQKEPFSTQSIRMRLKRLCKKLGIYHKSPHKIRKTYGSILLDNHVDQRLIIGQMGHTDIMCTENYYHRNRRSIEKKSQIISDIPEFRTKK